MATSGISASTDDLVLTGLVMYIDEDTTPSATISGESLEFSAEFATLSAGKGVKVKVAEVMKSFGIAMKFKVNTITAKGMSILYGGDYSTPTSPASTRVSFKGKMTAPVAHTFKFIGLNNEGKTITIQLNNAKNTEFGAVALDGSDFAAMPCTIVPSPLTPGDDTEVLAFFDIAN